MRSPLPGTIHNRLERIGPRGKESDNFGTFVPGQLFIETFHSAGSKVTKRLAFFGTFLPEKVRIP
jgi:hypothetical protein